MKSSTFDSIKFDELYLGREDRVWDKRRTFRVELNSEIKNMCDTCVYILASLSKYLEQSMRNQRVMGQVLNMWCNRT